MTPNQLVLELEHATHELLDASGADLDQVEKLLPGRSAVLAGSAATAANSFTPTELASLRDSLRNGEAALEKIALLRRRAALEWLRWSPLRPQSSPGDNHTFSLYA